MSWGPSFQQANRLAGTARCGQCGRVARVTLPSSPLMPSHSLDFFTLLPSHSVHPARQMSFTPAQRQRAVGLFRQLIRTSEQTFQGDAATVSAWRQQVRDKFQAASSETDPVKIEEGLSTWEEVVAVLRHNVVQGEYKEERKTFKLNFTKETELGSNESIKLGRQKQMDQLRASKGVPRCGSSSSSSSSSQSPSSVRGFSTYSVLRADKSKGSTYLPRPVPLFPQTILLSDGSSIQLTTTSPRSTVRLTRDPTNHPLWNPSMERTGGASEEDESGRLGRFRRRFGGTDDAAGQSDGSPQAQQTEFGAQDLSWMSVGGERGKGGSANANTQGSKGEKVRG